MRTAFINALLAEARTNPRLFLVVGDLGYSVVEPFAAEFPDRFLNAGVAEQNMTAVAAGLASEGFHVFTYSIANFPTLRCFEQIRNDVCYHGLPVTVVAVGAGLAYGNLGYSHHGVQDIAVMRTLPGLALLSPADPGETTAAVKHLSVRPGPSYLRLGKAGEKELHRVAADLAAGPIQVRAGDDPVALAATGSVLALAVAAADTLAASGQRVAVYSCPWLRPADTAFFAPLWRHRAVVTVEEHLRAGGFGSLLRELAPDGVRVRSLAVAEDVAGLVGSQDWLRAQAGLTPDALVKLVDAA